MAWNFACWCILTTFRTDYIMVTVCRFFEFWCYFDLVKRVKFGVSRHFGHALWIFIIIVTLWLKLVIFGVSGHYLENVWEQMLRGGRRHFSDALRRVLPNYQFRSHCEYWKLSYPHHENMVIWYARYPKKYRRVGLLSARYSQNYRICHGYMGQVTKVRLSYYLVLLSTDSKTR